MATNNAINNNLPGNANTSSAWQTGVVAVPSCSVYQGTTPTSLNSSSYTQVIFDTKNWDIGTYYSVSTGRYTPLKTGIYCVQAQIGIVGALVTDRSIISLFLNGSQFENGLGCAPDSSGFLNVQINTLVTLNGSTDYIDIRGISGSHNTNASGLVTYMNVHYIGPAS